MGDQESKVSNTIEKTFTVPADAKVEWAMLLTTVYCGHMQNNYQGTAKVDFNGKTLGTETLNVPYIYTYNGGNGHVQVNDHVNRVTSDYMMYYDVTSLVKSGENTAVVKTAPLDSSFDGRIRLITLVVAYDDGSKKTIWYQVNRGHDADSYYSDDEMNENYIGSTAFVPDLPEGSSLSDAELRLVYQASSDGAYTFNGKSLASGTAQGTFTGFNTWDVKNSLKSSGTNTLTYDRTASFYKNVLGILTVEYTASSSDDTNNTSAGNTTDNTSAGNTTDNTSAGNTTDNTSAGNTTDNTSAGNTTDNTSAGNTTDNTSAGNTTDNTSAGNTIGDASSADLGVQAIKVLHNSASKAWENLNNTVNVTLINNGQEDASSFALELYSDSSLLESKQVTGLAKGATGAVEFVWKPEEAKNYTLKAVVVPGSAISDTNATNNELSKTQEVMHNGYAGDKPLETYAHGTVKGNITYNYGDSSYLKLSSGGKCTVNHTLDLPEGATVKLARLYNYWTWSSTGTKGVIPTMTLDFKGSSITPEAEYTDQKGWGSQYDYPSGTWAYNVTELVSGSGTYTTTVTNTNSDQSNSFCVDGIALLVVYEDASGKEIEYWINEGCDAVSTMSSSGGLTPDEATVKVPFEGNSIDLSNVENARLWTTVQAGGHEGIALKFNEMNISGVYDSTPFSDLDIDEARDVTSYFLSQNNEAQIIAPSVTDNSGDYMIPSSAILAVNYKDGTSDDTNVTDNTSTGNTTDNTSTGNTTDNTSTGNTTDNTSTGNTTDNTSAGNTTDNTSAGNTTDNTSAGNNTSVADNVNVTLKVNIIPVISLTVSPDSLDFGTVSPGTPSESLPLTLQNNGGTSIKVTAEVYDQENGPFAKGLLLDQNIWSSYSKVLGADCSETSQAQLDLPLNYSSSGQFQGTLSLWAEAA
jgi:hypothetical protein